MFNTRQAPQFGNTALNAAVAPSQSQKSYVEFSGDPRQFTGGLLDQMAGQGYVQKGALGRYQLGQTNGMNPYDKAVLQNQIHYANGGDAASAPFKQGYLDTLQSGNYGNQANQGNPFGGPMARWTPKGGQSQNLVRPNNRVKTANPFNSQSPTHVKYNAPL